MTLLVWIVLFTGLGGIVSAAFAGLFLLVPEEAGRRMLPHFVSFATGALLGAALLALLPEAMVAAGSENAHAVGVALVAGLGIFFIIEKLVLWKHAHSHDDDEAVVHAHGQGEPLGGEEEAGGRGHARDSAAGVLVLIGDSIHNALDGILIAAAFLTDVSLGLVTTFAVAAHEVPHRVGDFAILVHSGMTRRRALVLNMATGIPAILGGVGAYFGLHRAMGALPYALAIAAAGFLYIAVAGLIPGLHRRSDPRTSLTQVLLIAAGIGVVAWAEALAH